MLYIYVLQLQNDKYYVGKTMNTHFRFDNHFTHNGTEWTKLNRPLKILELIPNCDDYDEEKYTYKYMDKFGIDNVRGGSYSSVILDTETIKQLKKISNSINNRCYICGKADGHFAKECDANANANANANVRIQSTTPSALEHKYTYIPFQTLLTESPNKMRCNVNDIDIIGRLRVFRITPGYGITLNYGKTQYDSLHELIEDAMNIFYKYNDAEHTEPLLVKSLEQAKILNDLLLPCKIGFYKNILELLELLSADRCKLLQSGRSFNEVENDIIQNSSLLRYPDVTGGMRR